MASRLPAGKLPVDKLPAVSRVGLIVRVTWWVWLVGRACAPLIADTVWVVQENAPDRARRGEIVDYRADYLVLRRGPNVEERIASARIVRIETNYGGMHQRAEGAFAAGRYDEAGRLFEQAMGGEQREWVQRAELARMIQCDHNLGRDLQAARRFIILARHDPTLLHLDVAPLHWRSRTLNAAMKQWAGEHLRDETFAVSRLIAASWLLAGDRRKDAIDELTRLTRGSNRRIAQLAAMQQWRARWPGMSTPPLEEAAQKIAEVPESLRRGGCYVVAQAYDRADRGRDAVLWWLRVALLYGDDAPLASDSLWRAGDRLQRDGETIAARRLFFELIEKYPNYPEAARAARRIEVLRQASPPRTGSPRAKSPSEKEAKKE